MRRIMLTLDINARKEVAKDCLLSFCFMPTLAAVTIISDYYPAVKLGVLIITFPWMIATRIIVIILIVISFGIIIELFS